MGEVCEGFGFPFEGMRVKSRSGQQVLYEQGANPSLGRWVVRLPAEHSKVAGVPWRPKCDRADWQTVLLGQVIGLLNDVPFDSCTDGENTAASVSVLIV